MRGKGNHWAGFYRLGVFLKERERNKARSGWK
jgi:hypothetical protein